MDKVVTATPVQSRAESVRARTGADYVEKLPFDLSQLVDDGLFINVDVQGFSRLDRRMSWDDMGVRLPEIARGDRLVAFHSPHVGLLPDRVRSPLLRCAHRAHHLLRMYGFRFHLVETIYGSTAYRWVPWTAWEEFEAGFQNNLAELDTLKADVLTQYDTLRTEVTETIKEFAIDSVRRLIATGAKVPENYHELLSEKILQMIPTPDQIREISIYWKVGVLYLGSEMLAEQRLAVQERQQLAEAEAERAEGERQQRLAERKLQLELAFAEEEQRKEAAIRDRLRNLRMEAARDLVKQSLNPIEEGVQQLQAAIHESATALAESLSKNGFVAGASAKRTRRLVKWFRLMNWQNDETLTQLLGELERLAQRPEQPTVRRDAEQFGKVLDDIIHYTYDSARSVAATGRAVRYLEF